MISDIAVSVFCIFMGVISLYLFEPMYSASRMKIDEISYTKKKMKERNKDIDKHTQKLKTQE